MYLKSTILFSLINWDWIMILELNQKVRVMSQIVKFGVVTLNINEEAWMSLTGVRMSMQLEICFLWFTSSWL